MNSTSNYSSGQPQDNSPSEEPTTPQPPATPEPQLQPAKPEKSMRSAETAEPEVHIGMTVQDTSQLAQGTPPVSDACVLHGDEPDHGFTRVIMTQSAIAQVQAHSQSDISVELGGLLLGRVYTHNQETYVEVERAIPAESADKGSVHFTFTADTWSQLNKAGAAYPDLIPVGWFHTHPDLGVFFSSDDEVVHATFPHRWMVGLVVDPVREQVNYFGWLAERILPIGGFYELIDKNSSDPMPRATMPWRVMIDHSWFGAYPGLMRSGGRRNGNREVAGFDEGLPPISPWVGALLGGTSLAISVVTLGLVVYKFWLQ